MEAEICFLNPTDASSATAALIERGFAVENLDWVDDDGLPTVWIKARITTELTDGFFDRVASIADPFNGFVVEAGKEQFQ